MDLKEAVYGIQTNETRVFVLIQYIYIRKGVDISGMLNPIIDPVKLFVLSNHAIKWFKTSYKFD